MTAAEKDRAHTAAEEFLRAEHGMLLAGEKVAAVSGEVFATENPAVGREIARVPRGGVEDVDRAVRAARAAFDAGEWARCTPVDRERLLLRVADLLEERADLFSLVECLDNGKAVSAARAVDVRWSIEQFRYYAGWATKIEGTTPQVSMPLFPGAEFHAYVLREPIGVIGQIVPWNFPLLMATMKLAPALATGNTCVLKPAEQTPLTALLLGDLLNDAGVPPGVVNIVTGFADAGRALVAHPDVDKIAFTGSTEVGQDIVRGCADDLKRVSLELGGKSPNIVCADADFDAALPGVVNGILFNHGQNCVAGSRLYVARERFDEFVESVAQAMSAARVGPGIDATTEVGPLVSREQLDRVLGYVDAGREAGARVLTGGARRGEQGYFVEPTVLVDAPADASVVREEIFGPVLVATPFDSEEEVLAAANDSSYGLAAAVWTQDLSRAHRMARRIKAGSVWINQYNAFDTALPFGGYKRSGWGRELGKDVIDLYTETKAVNVRL